MTNTSYQHFLTALQSTLTRRTQSVSVLFQTRSTRDLYDVFLQALPEDMRQEHTCRTCAAFIRNYGGLVSIDDLGRTRSVLWDFPAPAPYGAAVERLREYVEDAPIAGVFASPLKTWGHPTTGAWQHMAIPEVPPALIFKETPLLEGHQHTAQLAQNYKTLADVLKRYSYTTVSTAVRLLDDGKLARAEKARDRAIWFRDLLASVTGRSAAVREALVWRAVALAPAGWANVPSSVLGALLDDLSAGIRFDEVKRRWDAKLDATVYQRPQAAPKAGNVVQAEKIVEALGTAGALSRRFASVDDIRPLWTPHVPAPPPTSGVFAGLGVRKAPEPVAPTALAPTVMTWEKFQRTVLSEAVRIDLQVPSHGPFYQFVTAVHPDAPPILQWDREDDRNPVSWYTYTYLGNAHDWGLTSGVFTPVVAISKFPFEWTSDLKHQGPGVLFILKGAIDKRYKGAGAGYFPEALRSEYHGVRATLEAHAQRSAIQALPDGKQHAAGIGMRESSKSAGGIHLRVLRRDNTVSIITLDRWD